MIKKYIKKPVEVEAIQLTENNIEEVYNFVILPITSMFTINLPHFIKRVKKDKGVYLETLEGTMKANFGDYIIKGIKGEFYPCKPDIFEATYQSVDNFIDLNKLKNYICFTESANIMTQYSKIKEEINEFYLEFIYKPNGEKIIAEGLDVMTAMYNYLDMIGLTKEDFEKHITKLNKYKETKYKR